MPTWSNRRAWPELVPLFLPDATVTLDLRDDARSCSPADRPWDGSSGSRSKRFEFFEFIVLNLHVAFPEGVATGHAVGRLFMNEVRQERDSGRWTMVYGLYHDRYAFREGRWRIAERRYHSLARTARDLDAYPVPDDPGIVVPGIAP